jgi:hypothetical protein
MPASTYSEGMMPGMYLLGGHYAKYVSTLRARCQVRTYSKGMMPAIARSEGMMPGMYLLGGHDTKCVCTRRA